MKYDHKRIFISQQFHAPVCPAIQLVMKNRNGSDIFIKL